MNNQFKRLLALAKKTGDRLVVTDPEGSQAFVIMDIDEYEALLDIYHDDYTDDFTSDLAEDDSAFADDDFGDSYPDEDFQGFEQDIPENLDEQVETRATKEPPKDIWEAMATADQEGDTWNIEAMNQEERANLESQFATWKAEAKEEVEPVTEQLESKMEAQDQGDDEEFGEERFYLEPIE